MSKVMLFALLLVGTAQAAVTNVYWRLDLHQGSSIIAYGQGATEQSAWEDCFRLKAITRAMTAAETRRNAVAAITTPVVRWCQNPKRYATVTPDPTTPPLAAGTATLNWSHDGLNLDGFRVVYGTRADQLVNSVQLSRSDRSCRSNAQGVSIDCQRVFQNLPAATYYFAVIAYGGGNDSSLSTTIPKVVM